MKRLLASFLALVMVCYMLPTTVHAAWPPDPPVITGCEENDGDEHNFVVVQSREPSCTQSGLVRWRCYECGYIVDVGYPALGHNYEDGFCTRCGQADSDAIPAGTTLRENFTVLDGTDGTTQGESCANAVDANDDSEYHFNSTSPRILDCTIAAQRPEKSNS